MPGPLGVSEVHVVWMPGGVRTEIHLGAAQTGGAFCLLVDHPPARWSLPPHKHLHEAETIHVIEGEFEMRIDGVDLRLGPGQTAHIPAGTVHSGGNVGRSTGRRVILFSPAGLERFFVEAGAPDPGHEMEPLRAAAVASRHGWEFVAG